MILYPMSLHITATKTTEAWSESHGYNCRNLEGKSFSMFTTKQNIRYAYV